MRPLAKIRSRSLSDWTRPLPRFAVGAAWFFILFSLAHLAWVVGVKWGDPAGLTTLYQATVMTLDGPETHRAWGMAYDGTAGLLLALAQAVAVVAAAVCSTRPRGRTCRIGHAVLIAWAALWTLNLVNLAGIDGRPDSVAAAGVMAVLFGATVFRAARPRPTRNASRGDEPRADAAPGEHAPLPESPLTAEHVSSSDRVREIEIEFASPAPQSRLDRMKNLGSRVSNAMSRAGSTGRRAADRMKPAAAAAGRQLAGAGIWLTTKLRASGVIPRGRETTSL